MAKSTKSTPARKPVKARGALPSPKSAPQRTNKRWYRHQGWQLVAIVVTIAVVGGVWAGGGSWLRNRKETRTHSQAVARFDRSYSALKSPVVDVLSAVSTKGNEFATGALPAPDFKRETENWLTQLRKMDSELRKRRIPQGLPELDEARAVLVQGHLVIIDGVKAFALAADAQDPGIRNQAIQQGKNLLAHADSIVGTGEGVLQRLKVRFGLEEVQSGRQGGAGGVGQPVQLPPEEAPSTTGDRTTTDGTGIPGTPSAGGQVPPAPGGANAGTAPPAAP